MSLKHIASLLVVVVVLNSSIPALAQVPGQDSAASGKIFSRSVLYGTLAGTLVGFASLAFTANPGGNLNNVARGASYGLYTGILLGAYVAYGVSDEPEGDQGPSLYEGGAPLDVKPRSDGANSQKSFPVISMIPLVGSQASLKDWGGLLQGTFRF